MSMDILHREPESLPDHIAIGFRDEATQAIDIYVAKVNGRIDEAIVDRTDDAADIEEVGSIAADLVIGEVAERAAEVLGDTDIIDVEEIQRELRRRQIRAQNERKRRFARPILSYANTHNPLKLP